MSKEHDLFVHKYDLVTRARALPKAHFCALFTSENFKRFCDKLTRRVPLVYLWAAAVQCDFRPSCLEEVALKQPFRSPPEVEQLVSKAKEIQFGHVPGYTPTGLPAESEGPRVRLIAHTNGQSGHTEERPQDCFQCGVEVATILRDLRVGEGE